MNLKNYLIIAKIIATANANSLMITANAPHAHPRNILQLAQLLDFALIIVPH